MKPFNALPAKPVTSSKSSGLSRPYKPNVPLNYQCRRQAEPEEITVAAAAEMTSKQTEMDRHTKLLPPPPPPRYPPPSPPTQINIEVEDKDQNQPFPSTDISNTSKQIPPHHLVLPSIIQQVLHNHNPQWCSKCHQHPLCISRL